MLQAAPLRTRLLPKDLASTGLPCYNASRLLRISLPSSMSFYLLL